MPLSVPDWLFLGLAYAAGAATLAVAAFALTGRAFPANPLAGTRLGDRFGSTRHRGNVRRYLDAIRERYVEDAVVGDVRVAFYLPDRDVALVLSRAAADRLRHAETYVVYCAPRMRADQLADRLPFQTPTVERSRGARPGDTYRTTTDRTTGSRAGRRRQGAGERQDARTRVSRAFRTLGVPRDASVEEVQSAYREKVKDVHPDHGGSEEAFARVQDAYATAKRHAD